MFLTKHQEGRVLFGSYTFSVFGLIQNRDKFTAVPLGFAITFSSSFIKAFYFILKSEPRPMFYIFVLATVRRP